MLHFFELFDFLYNNNLSLLFYLIILEFKNYINTLIIVDKTFLETAKRRRKFCPTNTNS